MSSTENMVVLDLKFREAVGVKHSWDCVDEHTCKHRAPICFDRSLIKAGALKNREQRGLTLVLSRCNKLNC